MKLRRYYEGFCKKRIGYDFYADIAENIVRERQKNGWTQEELAKRSGVRLSKLRNIETVRSRIWLSELQNLAKALSVSELYLTGEAPESKAGECLFTVANERYLAIEFYFKAQSYGLAFLTAHENVKGVRWFEPRDRAIVKLVGIPVTDAELAAKFPKRTDKDDSLEKDAEDSCKKENLQ